MPHYICTLTRDSKIGLNVEYSLEQTCPLQCTFSLHPPPLLQQGLPHSVQQPLLGMLGAIYTGTPY